MKQNIAVHMITKQIERKKNDILNHKLDLESYHASIQASQNGIRQLEQDVASLEYALKILEADNA